MPKVQCVFNLLYFYPIQPIIDNQEEFSSTLSLWMNFVVAGDSGTAYQNMQAAYTLILLTWKEDQAPDFVKDKLLFNAFQTIIAKLAVAFIPTIPYYYKLYFWHFSQEPYLSQMTVIYSQEIILGLFNSPINKPKQVVLETVYKQGSISENSVKNIKSADTTIILLHS